MLEGGSVREHIWNWSLKYGIVKTQRTMQPWEIAGTWMFNGPWKGFNDCIYLIAYISYFGFSDVVVSKANPLRS